MPIQVVVVNGRLVGRRFQDRWNMAQLGFTHLDMNNIREDMRQFRKASGGEFLLDTVKGDMIGISGEERQMFGRHVAKIAA